MSPGLTAWAQNCATLDVVIARGTVEPGYLGAAIGDPLYAVLSAQLPVDTTAHRVEYPADLLVPTSMIDGTRAMTGHLIHQAAACPDQRFVLVGYSQGRWSPTVSSARPRCPVRGCCLPSCPRAWSPSCSSVTPCD
ncbi:cutinase family protein [Nocardia fluminea]